MERLTRVRAGIFLILFCMLIGFFAIKLYDLQIVQTGGDTDNVKKFYTVTRVKAARGDILDNNGNKLIGNRASYNLVFNNFVLTNSDKPNDHLLRLVKMTQQLGVDYIENFPITLDRPYEYTLAEQTAAWQGYFQDYLWELDIDSDISASRLMEALRSRYKIPAEWTDEEARAVIRKMEGK